MNALVISNLDGPAHAGQRQLFELQGIGPSSYNQTTGDIILPGPTTFLSCVPGGFLSASGKYVLEPFPSITNNLRPVWAFRWKYSGLGANTAGFGVPISLGPATVASTVSAVASKVGSVTVANTFSANNFVYLSGFTQLGALNGTIVRLLTATPTGVTFNLGTAANVSSGADTTGKLQLVQVAAGNPLALGTSASITNSIATASLLTMTSSLNPGVGTFVYLDLMVNGAAANGVIVQVASSSTTQFTANWNGTGNTFSTGADTGTAWTLVTNGGAQVTAVLDSIGITNTAATASSAGTAGVATITAAQALTSGLVGVFQGLTNGSKLNGTVTAPIAANLSYASFQVNEQIALISTGADAGVFILMDTGIPAGGSEVATGTNLSGESVQFYAIGGEM